MSINLAQKAVSCALKGNWQLALDINLQILKEAPKDIDALNRLARAYSELGDYEKAKKIARKVLKIDSFNTIAKKSLSKWEMLKDGDIIASGPTSADEFLEEPGKTKLVNLMHLCNEDVIAKLDSGDEVIIRPHGHRISITTKNGTYIGKLPDDLSVHLRKLIKYGNEYKALIKSIEPKSVKLFIREVSRTKKLRDIPSFSPEKIEYISFTPPELVHKKGSMSKVDFEND